MNKHICFVLLLSTTFVFSTVAYGHFIWVAKSAETGKVNVYFGEGPYPDKAQFLGGIEAMQVWSVDANGAATPVKFEKKTDGEDGWFECISTRSLSGVDADCQYGLFSRGEKSMFLHYSAKYVDFQPGMKTKVSGKLPLDVACKSSTDATSFLVTFNGKPAADCEVQIVDENDKTHELKTDRDGNATFKAVPKSRWLVRAKVVEASKGQHDGKTFDEKRFYCTLTIGLPDSKVAKADVPQQESKPEGTATKMKKSPYPNLPVGITSFGGAVANNHLYVFGGHCGDAHDYYKSGQNATLYRLNMKQPEEWEAVNKSSGLQGLAMVEHGGNLYRVGGFEARNAQGEDQDLHSVDQFARFNVTSNSWEPLPPMPAPRSSLDAVVVGDKLYVVGGWNLQGNEPKVWHDTFVSIDLADKAAKWETTKVPFKRRALSVGHQGDKLCVIGGMRDKAGPTTEVSVFDLKNKTWSDGPKLPGTKGMEGFGNSCFNIGGRLVVSTYGGSVLKLNEKMDGWEKIHQLETGRFFHRLLPYGNDQFVLVGGANMDIGKLVDVVIMDAR